MTRIMICDDQQQDQEMLSTIIRLHYGQDDVAVHCFSSGREALSQLQQGLEIDIAFLDILMPHMKGTALARQMRESGFMGYIVFLTTSNDFAAESYGVNAYSYLLKPPDGQELGKLLAEIDYKRQYEDKSCILVKSKKGIQTILVRDISHIETCGHNLIFHFAKGGCHTIYATLRQYQEQIQADARLRQCHHSFFVNLEQVTGVVGNHTLMRNGERVPISKKYAGFKKQYIEWVFGEEME